MKKIYIKYLILIILIIIQGTILIASNKKEEKKKFNDAVKVSINNDKDINEVFNDFKKLNGVIINSINDENGIKVNIDFEGDIKSVERFLENIIEYCISDYEIRYQDEKFLLKLLLQEYKNKKNI